MTKVLRVKDETFDELVKHGTWSDTMDMIISRVLRQTTEAKTKHGEDMIH
jgi:hypothetical protein